MKKQLKEKDNKGMKRKIVKQNLNQMTQRIY